MERLGPTCQEPASSWLDILNKCHNLDLCTVVPGATRKLSREMARGDNVPPDLWQARRLFPLHIATSATGHGHPAGDRIGWVREDIKDALLAEPDLFAMESDADDDRPRLVLRAQHGAEETSEALDKMFREWRGKAPFDDTALCVPLEKWRNEAYGVWSCAGRLLFRLERAMVGYLGVCSYGVHLNAYVQGKPDQALHGTSILTEADRRRHGWKMWFSRRSFTKDTFPGFLDQIAAGGLPFNLSPDACLIKEAQEEASIPASLAQKAIPVGTVSYVEELDTGVFPEIQYCYDLVVPTEFTPRVNDGEVDGFYCETIDQVLQRVRRFEFKPNCALVILDFCIRHGILTPTNTSCYVKLSAGIHQSWS